MIIGTNTHQQKIALDEVARARHVYVIGQTGTGKTTLLQNCIAQDMQEGRGLCFLDPHGDTARSVIAQLPEQRKSDLIWIDLSDISEPPGLNFMTGIATDMRPLLARNFVAAFKHVFGDESWGPRMDHTFRMSVRTLMDNELTLLAFSRLFIDEEFRERAISRVADPYVARTFWREQFPRWHAKFGADLTSPIENKISAVIESPHLRAIMCQSHNSITLRDAMDQRKIVIVSLQKGQVGEQAASVFGSLLVSFIGQAALSRADIPEKDRTPFTLYCDEFQNYATSGFPLIMSEARKYKLSLVLAHQDIGQVENRSVISSIFGNCGTFVSFRIGADDAPKIARQFRIPNEGAFLDLPNFQAWCRPLINGSPGSATVITTLPAPKPLHARSNEFISFSRRRFGRHFEAVDRDITKFLSCAPLSKTNHTSSASNSTSKSSSQRKKKRSSARARFKTTSSTSRRDMSPA